MNHNRSTALERSVKITGVLKPVLRDPNLALSFYHGSRHTVVRSAWRFSKTARTRTFPGADVGSNHDMVMMTFQTRLKNSRNSTQPRIRFDLEKLNYPTVMSVFQATIGGRFAPLAMLVDEDADLDSMVTHFNKAVTDTAAERLGKQRRKRKPWVTPKILDLCDQRRDLKKKKLRVRRSQRL